MGPTTQHECTGFASTLTKLVALVFCVAGAVSTATAQPLVNPGFESGGALCEVVDQFGVWEFDGGNAVGATLGIVPTQGSAMLWLQCTAPCCDRAGSGLSGTGADIAQLVDLTPSLLFIQRGNVVATFSVAINRVAGNAQTDTQFYVDIRSYDVPSPTGFHTGCNTFVVQESANARQYFLSDSDPATWELIQVSLSLPATTRFIQCAFGAIENVNNGAVYCDEFDGHFADDARLSVSCGSCPADINCDGVANSQDFFAFLGFFFGNLPEADFNHDGTITSQDFFDFLAAFFTPCP